jgi:hypothetical protein
VRTSGLSSSEVVSSAGTSRSAQAAATASARHGSSTTTLSRAAVPPKLTTWPWQHSRPARSSSTGGLASAEKNDSWATRTG